MWICRACRKLVAFGMGLLWLMLSKRMNQGQIFCCCLWMSGMLPFRKLKMLYLIIRSMVYQIGVCLHMKKPLLFELNSAGMLVWS